LICTAQDSQPTPTENRRAARTAHRHRQDRRPQPDGGLPRRPAQRLAL